MEALGFRVIDEGVTDVLSLLVVTGKMEAGVRVASF